MSQHVVFDWGRETKLHFAAERQPSHTNYWTACGMSLKPDPRIRFEDEVDREDICLKCRRVVIDPRARTTG